MDDVKKLQLLFSQNLQTIKSLNDLQVLTTTYLGRNGKVNKLLENIKVLRPEERPIYGKRLNELKNLIADLLKRKETELVKKKDIGSQLDITLPGTAYPRGSLHIVTLAIEEISKIFERIGFIRMSYPEVEWEYFSFDALNMGKDQPARDDFETFFIDAPASPKYGKMVLTPHTSSGQPREMLRLKKPPMRMINIARCYRPNWDVSHVPMFYQFEGLCIDRGINITHLKGTIDYFAKEFFGPERETRLRPFHFQFTEPSFEVDITCGVCLGKGVVNGKRCKICKSGWLELGGSGMMHPNVLRAGGIDPNKYTGWAFGIGVERVMMMKEGLKLDDIRVLYNGDISFLEQF